MGTNPPNYSSAPQSARDPLDFVFDRLKNFGAVVTAVVGLASTMFACSADNIKRNDAFTATVATQEKQWQSLYDQYFSALAAKDDSDGLREKRLLSICQFSNRIVPNFSEHKLGYFWIFDRGTRQEEANDQLEKLKTGLRTALATDGIGTPASVECVLDQKREQDEDTRNLRERVAQVVTPGQPESVSKVVQRETASRVRNSAAVVKSPQLTNTAPSQATLTLAVGDPRGYDIDVFWCVGPDDRLRQKSAEIVAALLTSQAKARAKIADGFLVGRVRLRPLAIDKQLSGSYPSSGFEVRGDSYERTIAEQLRSFLNKSSGVGPFSSFESGLDTKWYLSVFVCS